jgi:hypothetical protein
VRQICLGEHGAPAPWDLLICFTMRRVVAKPRSTATKQRMQPHRTTTSRGGKIFLNLSAVNFCLWAALPLYQLFL